MVGWQTSNVEDEHTLLGNPGGELALQIRGGEHDGRVLKLSATKCTIGSAPDCTLRLHGSIFQPVHCLILRGASGTGIRRWAPDTRLNGRPFLDAPLSVGDNLSIAGLDFEVIAVPRREETLPPDLQPRKNRLKRLRRALARKQRRWDLERTALERQLAEWQQKLDVLNARRQAVTTQLDQLTTERETLKANLQQAQEQLGRAQQRFEQERQTWLAERRRLLQAADQRLEQIHRAEQEARDAQARALKTLSDLQQEEVRLHQELERAAAERDEAIAAQSAAINELTAVQTACTELEEKLAQCRLEAERDRGQWAEDRHHLANEAARWQAQALTQEHAHTKRNRQHEAECAQLRTELSRVRQELEVAEQSRKQAEPAKEDFTAQREVLEQNIARLEQELLARQQAIDEEREAWAQERHRLAHLAAQWEAKLLAADQQRAHSAKERGDELEVLQQQKAHLEQQLAHLKDAHASAEAQLERARRQAANLQQELTDVRIELEQIRQQHTAEVAEWADERHGLEQALADLRSQAAERDQAGATASQAAEKEIQHLRAQADEMRERLQKAEAAREQAENAHQSDDTNTAQLHNALQELRAELGRQQNEFQHAQAGWNVERNRLIEQWESRKQRLEQQLQSAEESVQGQEALAARCRQVEQELAEWKARAEHFRQQVSKLEEAEIKHSNERASIANEPVPTTAPEPTPSATIGGFTAAQMPPEDARVSPKIDAPFEVQPGQDSAEEDVILFRTISDRAPVSSLDVLRQFGLTLEDAADDEPLEADSTSMTSGGPSETEATSADEKQHELACPPGPLASDCDESTDLAPAEDEESIENYMNRLLQRVRGQSRGPQALPEGIERNEPALAATLRKAVQAGPEPPVPAPPAPRKYVPRQAPEKSAELSAMRELANSTARIAIDSSHERRHATKTLSKLIVTIFATVTGTVLLLLRAESENLTAYGAAAAFIIAIGWGLQTVSQARRLVRARRTANTSKTPNKSA